MKEGYTKKIARTEGGVRKERWDHINVGHDVYIYYINPKTKKYDTIDDARVIKKTRRSVTVRYIVITGLLIPHMSSAMKLIKRSNIIDIHTKI